MEHKILFKATNTTGGIYLLKVNNGNTTAACEISSKQQQWHHNDVNDVQWVNKKSKVKARERDKTATAIPNFHQFKLCCFYFHLNGAPNKLNANK